MVDKMLVAFVMVVAMAPAAMTECSTPMTSYEFQQMYCGSDVVFRGTRYQATSGVAIDEQGRDIESAKVWFHLTLLYQLKTTITVPTVVYRSWHEGQDQCDRAAFPDNTGHDFLVFANGTDSLYVDPCRHSFPWPDCVNQDFRDMLPNISCSQNRRSFGAWHDVAWSEIRWRGVA